MSISEHRGAGQQQPNLQAARHTRITAQILSLFSDDRLAGKIAIPVLNLETVDIVFIDFRESIQVCFGEGFPGTPPAFRREKSLFQSIVTQSNSLDCWTPTSNLSDIISDIHENIKSFTESQSKPPQPRPQSYSYPQPQMKQQIKRKDSKQSSQEGTKRKVMMNGCADNELTETKNLNRHFRSKLREVYFDVTKDGSEAPQDAKWIQSSFNLPRVGFEDIAKMLKNSWFNLEVNKQMENGKFMHKIMKGMMSIKSKKLMVKYYHVMLAAARDPDNFVKWKYQ